MEDCCYTGSHLDLFELAGAPLCMPLLVSNLTNDVDLGAGPIEKPVSNEFIRTATFKEVVVPNVEDISAKSFVQVLSKTCVVPHFQFPKPSSKGESCKNHLHGRLILAKGDPPMKLEDCGQN